MSKTETRHTPGPWYLEGNWSERRVEFDYTDSNGNRHSGNIGVIDGMRGQQNEANARLIAAAPELLAACRQAEEYLAAIGDGPRTRCRILLCAAIAKAEGAQ